MVEKLCLAAQEKMIFDVQRFVLSVLASTDFNVLLSEHYTNESGQLAWKVERSYSQLKHQKIQSENTASVGFINSGG